MLEFLGKDDPDFTYDAKSIRKDLYAIIGGMLIVYFGYLISTVSEGYDAIAVISIGLLVLMLSAISVIIGINKTLKKNRS